MTLREEAVTVFFHIFTVGCKAVVHRRNRYLPECLFYGF